MLCLPWSNTGLTVGKFITRLLVDNTNHGSDPRTGFHISNIQNSDLMLGKTMKYVGVTTDNKHNLIQHFTNIKPDLVKRTRMLRELLPNSKKVQEHY